MRLCNQVSRFHFYSRLLFDKNQNSWNSITNDKPSHQSQLFSLKHATIIIHWFVYDIGLQLEWKVLLRDAPYTYYKSHTIPMNEYTCCSACLNAILIITMTSGFFRDKCQPKQTKITRFSFLQPPASLCVRINPIFISCLYSVATLTVLHLFTHILL